jgi:hypothetical protein
LVALGVWLALYLPRGILAVCCLGVALRVLIAAIIGDIPYGPGSDPFGYADIARNLLSGIGFTSGGFRAIYPPLYSLLMAPLGATLLNILVDVGTAVTICVIGIELDSPRAGKVAAALFMTWPALALQVTTPQKDGLAMLIGAQIGLAALRLRREWRRNEALRLGVCAGLMGLAQPAFAPFAGVAAIAMAPRRAPRIALWSLPVALLVMLPWWIRNWTVFHAFIPFTTAFGYNLLVAVTGYYTPLHRFTLMGELPGSRAAAVAAWQFAGQYPAHVTYVRVAAVIKAAVFERAFTQTLYWVPEAATLRASVGTVFQVYWVSILALAIVGIRRVPVELRLLLAACLAQFALFNVWFDFAERHRYLAVPFVMLVVGFAVTEKLSSQTVTIRG